MNSIEFTVILQNKISDKLIEYFGDKLDTTKPHLERESHAYSFYIISMNSMTRMVGDYQIAGYKLDDCNDIIHYKGIVESERNRLLKDIDECDNIVLFIIDKFNLK